MLVPELTLESEWILKAVSHKLRRRILNLIYDYTFLNYSDLLRELNLTTGKLNFLLGYERSKYLKDIQNVKNVGDIRDAYVVVNASRGTVESLEVRMSLPSFFINPPNNWRVVKVISDSDYGVYGKYNTTIYYAP